MRGVYKAALPTIRGPVKAGAPFLPHDWRVAQSFTDRPVKITLPGPLTISDTTYDAHYGDLRALGRDLAAALNAEVLALAEAGCRHIRSTSRSSPASRRNALAFGFENLERCFPTARRRVVRTVHMCCGYPDRIDRDDYPKAPQDSYNRLADAIDQSTIMAVSIEDAHRHNDLSLLEAFKSTTVILGVVAIAKSRLEPVEEIRGRLSAALQHIDAERLWRRRTAGSASSAASSA